MKWAILLGSPDISGGTYVIFEHALRIQKNGISVTIITDTKINHKRLDWHPESKKLIWKTFDEVADEKFDLVFATWWKTVFELYKIKADQYAYFVQSIESRFYNEDEKPLKKLVESTYILPLHIITETKWIVEYLKTNYNKKAFLVPNGIRKDIYKCDGESYEKRDSSILRVLVEGPVDVFFKNIPGTIEICRRSQADEIWLLTSSPISSYKGVDRVFSRVPIFETPKIYRSCDVIVKLSYVEGMFGPPLEMYHCGGTSITYDVTGHDEYIISDVNGFVAKTDDENEVVEYINKLKNPQILNELKNNAIETACNWPDWDTSSSMFIKAGNEMINDSEKADIKSIETATKFFFDWYVLVENYKLNKIKKQKWISKLKRILEKMSPWLFFNLKKVYRKIRR